MEAYAVRVELMDWVVVEAESEEEAIEEAKWSVFHGDITAEVERVSAGANSALCRNRVSSKLLESEGT